MRTLSLLLALLLVLVDGCATNHVVHWKAKPHIRFDKEKGENVEVTGQPMYYALLPLTIAFDVVTAPIQFGILLSWPATKAPRAQDE